MPTLDEVKRQIAACPHRYVFWTEKEIRALPEILDNDEKIKAVTSGMLDGATWLAVCTSRRLIFLNRGMIYGLRQIQFPLDRIQSIDHEFTIFFGSTTRMNPRVSRSSRLLCSRFSLRSTSRNSLSGNCAILPAPSAA